ncbi:phage tail protein I [Pseudomonas aeruginosa]|uniref:phage tail protein I n=1 Tax=Pseudomonas aeruginosa TaxID=287 RepID=UPI0010532DA9|nr:phage tail protein I [Pseudomonas aeruginosa]
MSDDAPRLSVLPPNRSLLEAGLDLAFDKLLERITPPFPALMDPQATPAEFLPYLAADRGVTDWNPEAPESERRATTALAWAIKRQAGTHRALIHAVESMELAAKVTSWHELQPAGVPYSFTVEATVERPWLIGDFPRLWRRLNDAKSERDNLELVLVHETSGGLRAAAAAGTPMSIGDLELDGALPDLDLQGSLGAVTAAREFTINDYDLEAPTT